ncbi:hypothetical protein DVA86_20580 [Streptomyces armeniacus]|uniref:Uncharacterized protein n=1 Tax=Streptomyces armeniacus TaxID=83291 RepID=A0A345XSS4_9ACTN|nr:hypothetical protein [Streptomyces armeniacus]AXK34690.1 hypothetical protein DVA86_20580 [Streptomyces armeniacus]
MTTRTTQHPGTETSNINNSLSGQDREYHFVLTVRREDGGASTRSGVLAVPRGTRRNDTLVCLVKAHFPDQDNTVVLFFSLEENTL